MWSENIDNKIRAAAAEHIHEPGENAWGRMEVLLDQHLPRRKKRRGLLFFLLLALLAAVPGFFLVKKYTAGSRTSSVVQAGTLPASAVPQDHPGHASQSTPVLPDTSDLQPATAGKQLPASAGQTGTIRVTTIIQEPAHSTGHRDRKENQHHGNRMPALPATGKDKPLQPASSVQLSDPQVTAITNLSNQEQPKSVPAIPADSALTAAPAATDTALVIIKEDTPDTIMQKSRPQTTGRISFILSAGPDISSVGGKTGQWKAQYGIGVSFRLSDRLAIRAGFYATRKIYSADSLHYHAGFDAPLYYKLSKVEADCAVYEIPLLLTWHFKPTGRHNWFAAAGASSLIMKKEDYIVLYQLPLGPTYSHAYSYSNENSHLFSIIHLSGGYQYSFNKRLALMAEPYIKLPLAGVGHGKVKLSSAGILFSLRYSPF
ncbi:MAG: hypothetical protein ABW019_01690 [Chitinophagaceae bacterium]